jgi:hypothetical protein
MEARNAGEIYLKLVPPTGKYRGADFNARFLRLPASPSSLLTPGTTTH